MSLNRKLKYSLAINEAINQAMEKDESVFLIGQGVESPWYVGNTCLGLIEKYGRERVIDTPVSENAITGAAVGAAIAGMKPIIVHPRFDFLLYACDPIINEAANWNYMNGGRLSVPVVFWPIINRGGEQAAQHSQALQAIFAHIPGLKILAPSNAYDAKGLMISSIFDPNPVIFVDDRWLYNTEEIVPENFYDVPIGKANIISEGTDLTLISYSFMITQCKKAIEELKNRYSIELIDLRTIKPIDIETIKKSVNKTGKVVVVDATWKSFGVSSEIVALINDYCFSSLKTSVKRVTLPDCPAPAASTLEEVYYPDYKNIINTINEILL
jgi:pyruvate dehydrogenase E1 component beta subunit